MDKNFTFIPNHIEIIGDLPFEIIPSYFLRKANNIEINLITKNLDSIGSLISKTGNLPYAVSFSDEILSENEVYLKTEPLDFKDWKYYVVEYEGHGELLHKYQLTANLFKYPLEFDVFQLEQYENSYAFSYSPDIAYRFFADNDLTVLQTLNVNDLIKLSESYKKMCDIEAKYHEIKNSIFIYNSLRFLPNYNEYRILGLFTAIESLITHKPSKKETGDSLTHQIKTKIPLLLNRIDSSEISENYYQKEKLDTLWGKLYDYRSSIAHGTKADFNKELQLLESPIKITEYLSLCVKNLILLALEEPQLIQDLRKC